MVVDVQSCSGGRRDFMRFARDTLKGYYLASYHFQVAFVSPTRCEHHADGMDRYLVLEVISCAACSIQ